MTAFVESPPASAARHPWNALTIEAACVVCGSRAHEHLYRWTAGERIVKCRVCGLFFTHPLPDQAVLDAYYDNFSGPEIAAATSFLPIVERALRRYFRLIHSLRSPAGGMTFLDAGGGGGLYAKAAERLGCDVSYIDIDQASLDAARNTLRLAHVVEGDVERVDELTDREYDVIMARHVIEHVPDPNRFVSALRRCLKPDGLLILETPNMENMEQLAHPMIAKFIWPAISRGNPSASIRDRVRWTVTKPFSGINPPKHIYGFSLGNLEWLLRNHGLQIAWQKKTIFGDPTFDPLHYHKTNFRGRSFLGKVYYPYERVASALVGRLGRGSLLIALARKS